MCPYCDKVTFYIVIDEFIEDDHSLFHCMCKECGTEWVE